MFELLEDWPDMVQFLGCVFLGESKNGFVISDHSDHRYIKGTDESTLDKDSSVPLMHHDPNDLRSQIRFWILPQKRTLSPRYDKSGKGLCKSHHTDSRPVSQLVVRSASQSVSQSVSWSAS